MIQGRVDHLKAAQSDFKQPGREPGFSPGSKPRPKDKNRHPEGRASPTPHEAGVLALGATDDESPAPRSNPKDSFQQAHPIFLTEATPKNPSARVGNFDGNFHSRSWISEFGNSRRAVRCASGCWSGDPNLPLRKESSSAASPSAQGSFHEYSSRTPSPLNRSSSAAVLIRGDGTRRTGPVTRNFSHKTVNDDDNWVRHP